MSKQALSNIRVLDLARVLAGPWCTQNLADLGAEVIKVERPGTGDDTRGWGPPWLKTANDVDSSDSSYYSSTNRGKKSLTLDIAKPEGQAIIKELAAVSDVFIENYKVGDLKRYGLDYESIRKINPRIIYCSVTGYGQDGPSAHKPGYDFVFQGLAGLMSITGERDDVPGGGPQKVGIAIADVMTGMYATVAILAALHHRSVAGTGQYIDMALLDCMVAVGGNQAVGYLVTGNVPKRYGNAHANLVPYQVFPTKDAQIVIAVGNDGQWQRFCKGIERNDLMSDRRYAKVKDRVTRRDELLPEIERTLRTHDTKFWLDRLEAEGVPCGPINDYAQVFEDPQVEHRQLRIDIPRPGVPPVPTVASPLRLSETPPSYHLPPPLLGEHTAEILKGVLDKSDADIAALRAANIV
jgi:crotonobetainyl-CoA:carnitine CoA-transferase CaiB-like acyl-CoA transferase